MISRDDALAKLGELIRVHEEAVEEEERVTAKHTHKMPRPTLALIADEAKREIADVMDKRVQACQALADAQAKYREMGLL